MPRHFAVLGTIAVLALGVSTPALAGKPVPPPTIPDYDIVNFLCPSEVRVGVDLVVLVEITKFGTTDPGATLQILEGGGCCGGDIIRVEQVVYDATEAGKRQVSTTYSFNLGSYPAVSAGLWTDFSAVIWDNDPDPDYPRTCQVHVVP